MQEDGNSFDLNNGNTPSWTLKIHGKLLEASKFERFRPD
jgi:hypothetical protein